MPNNFLSGLKENANYTLTANGALARKSTGTALYDLFGLGAAYRNRSEEDCILLFKKAYEENPEYALKCLFYIADCRGGQGERRFFRVCARWLATYATEAMRRNMQYIPEYRRWDDFYCFVGTPLEAEAFAFIRKQLALDVQCQTPSLLAKWLKSENTSSKESRRLGDITRRYLKMSHKQYRKTLSILRTRINIVEKLMSTGQWDKIEFDKIPSKAGLIYKNAFARHDIERMKAEVQVQSYSDFAKDTTKKVNAKTLYPYECVAEALKTFRTGYYYSAKMPALDDTNRLICNKYWQNLEDYIQNKTLNALAVVDTSGSMVSSAAAAPINVAISLGLYCAEKAKGPFANHYISFSSRPQLIETEGVDFVDKVYRIYRTNLCENTNLEATFDMLLNTAIQNHCSQDDLPQTLIVISDMQIDQGSEFRSGGWYYNGNEARMAEARTKVKTMMELMREKWARAGYTLPNLMYWNVNAAGKDTILDDGPNVSYVSGFSPSLFEQILSNKTGESLMYETLDRERYAVIH